VNTLKRTYPFLIAAIVIVAIGAPIAQGTQRANPLAALTLKVKALQARVDSLERKAVETSSGLGASKDDLATVKSNLGATQQSVASLQTAVTATQSSVGSLSSCVRYGALPIARYTGYVYTSNGGATVGTTTALDMVESGQSPSAYAALLNPSCVGSNLARLSTTSSPVLTH
jgi:hypothetical protein